MKTLVGKLVFQVVVVWAFVFAFPAVVRESFDAADASLDASDRSFTVAIGWAITVWISMGLAVDGFWKARGRNDD